MLQVSRSKFAGSAVPSLLVDAARCWRDARDSGDAVQPRLWDLLERHDCALLAPVLDSLCLFYEAALGRPMAIGEALTLSEDEQRLLGLIEGTVARHCVECPEGANSPLDCAVCSTRIMLSLTVGQRGSGPCSSAYCCEPRSPNWNSFLPSGRVTVTLKPPFRPSLSG